jgi:hypothetical protein
MRRVSGVGRFATPAVGGGRRSDRGRWLLVGVRALPSLSHVRVRPQALYCPPARDNRSCGGDHRRRRLGSGATGWPGISSSDAFRQRRCRFDVDRSFARACADSCHDAADTSSGVDGTVRCWRAGAQRRGHSAHRLRGSAYARGLDTWRCAPSVRLCRPSTVGVASYAGGADVGLLWKSERSSDIGRVGQG